MACDICGKTEANGMLEGLLEQNQTQDIKQVCRDCEEKIYEDNVSQDTIYEKLKEEIE